jgi:hypothetical protein
LGTIEIIALVAELAPKEIDAGKPVTDLWRLAGGIVADLAAPPIATLRWSA